MATPSSWLADIESALRPPPKLSLSEWADEHFYLSAESAAEPGRWRTLPYQRGILDAITDPAIERVTVMKSARVGYTKCMNAAIAFYMAQDPCPILVVQPTVEDAEGYSKEEIAPMLRDCPAVAGLVSDLGKTSAQTILHKSFPGGVLSMVGANSGRGFRRVSRRVVIFDEVDGYPSSAGSEGDPIALGERRAEYYWNRKIVAGSTPLIAGASRIEEMFESGDRRRFHVPCPHCGHFDTLVFNDKESSGHVMRWPEGEPHLAYFECRACAGKIEEADKLSIIKRGEWRADAPFAGHASFHIWTAYSLSPNAKWGSIATEFLEAKKRPETLRAFTNLTLGEPWKERGEAPEYQHLYDRREPYLLGTVPTDDDVILTAGVDVQSNRFVYEVVAWNSAKESWSVDANEILGDTANEATWTKLDVLLDRDYGGHRLAKLAIDSGYQTQLVYAWARRHGHLRVIACKGVSGHRAIVSPPSQVDVTQSGKTARRGHRVWPVGVDIAKGEFYAWLRLRREEDGTFPAGYCHFPHYESEFFKQLTAEHLVTVVNKRTGRAKHEWQVLPNRENHYLDCRVYARAAAAAVGLDRMAPKPRASPTESAQVKVPTRPTQSPKPSQFWASTQRGNWLKRR